MATQSSYRLELLHRNTFLGFCTKIKELGSYSGKFDQYPNFHSWLNLNSNNTPNNSIIYMLLNLKDTTVELFLLSFEFLCIA
jgi:hypothetical protein